MHPDNRKNVPQRQIDIAKRNGSLIIETTVLLKLFEAYKKEIINRETIINMMTNEVGLLKY